MYNERTVVERSLAHVLEAPLPEEMEREIILVDDCSTDGTLQILERLAEEHPSMTLIRHEVNKGKGAAIQTAIAHANGDFCLVQDADLEYDPAEYPILHSAAARASFRNLAVACRSRASSGARNLSATLRRRRVSSAR